MQKQVIHFQVRLQEVACRQGSRRPHLTMTFNRSQITCHNCKSALGMLPNQQIDWNDARRQADTASIIATRMLREFLFANPHIRGEVSCTDLPPSVEFHFWLPSEDKRRKRDYVTPGTGLVRSTGVPIWIAFPNSEELDTIATFVGQVSMATGLKAARDNRSKYSAEQWYWLQPERRQLSR
jgi:hypothetical protein